MSVEHIPILTTIFSVYFFVVIFKHYSVKPRPYLLWWTIGVFTFGLGTATESINVLFDWSEINFKLWYISGALLGGFPLAQGSVYLLMNKRFADVAILLVMLLVAIGAVFIVLSPLALSADFDGKLDGKIFEWQWVRLFSPFINTYSFIFLVGGAVYSAAQYYKQPNNQKRFLGNILIAIGALLPGIGGSFTRAGYVNVLFITEFIGLILIYAGYIVIKNDKSESLYKTQLSSIN